MNLSLNWTQITRNLEALAAISGAVGVAAGGVSGAFQPLASAVPALAPWAPLLAAVGSFAYFLANGARKGVEALKAQGLDKQGPK